MKQQTNLKTPINRNQILMTFEKYGYPVDSMINKQRMISIFRAEYVRKRQTFDSNHIIQQIWDQSQATSKGQISIKTITDILEQAQNILQKRIQALTGSNGMIENIEKNIKQKQQQVKQFAKYYGEQRDKMNCLTKQLMNMKIQQQQNHFDLKSFRQDYQAINAIFSIEQPRHFTQYILPPKQQQIKLRNSNKLLTLFHITNILFLQDLLILSSLRLAMLTLTVLFHSYYLLLFGVEDPASYTYILLHYLFSIVTDIAFIVIHLANKFQIMPIQHSSHNIYVIIMIVFLLGSIALRIFSMIIYLNLGSTHSSKVVNYFVVLGQIFPPKKIQQHPQYAFYSKVNHQSISDQNKKKQSLYITQIKDPGNYNININSPPRETYIEYSSIQNYMDMKQ